MPQRKRIQRTLIAPGAAVIGPGAAVSRVNVGQRLRVQPPALTVQPVGFGSTSKRAVLTTLLPPRAPAPKPVFSQKLATRKPLTTRKPPTTEQATDPTDVQTIDPASASHRVPSTFELLKGLPTTADQVLTDGTEANLISEEDEDEGTTLFASVLIAPATPKLAVRKAGGCASDLSETWSPPVSHVQAEVASSKTEPAATPLAAATAFAAVLLAPVTFNFPEASTLREIWEQRSDVYRLMRMRSAKQRSTLMAKLADQGVGIIDESPCTSTFSSLGSFANSSQRSSFLAAREAARAEVQQASC